LMCGQKRGGQKRNHGLKETKRRLPRSFDRLRASGNSHPEAVDKGKAREEIWCNKEWG